MPELINDWDSTKSQPTVRWGVKCTRCRQAKVSDTAEIPEGWEEDKAPNDDGCIQAQCPDCGK